MMKVVIMTIAMMAVIDNALEFLFIHNEKTIRFTGDINVAHNEKTIRFIGDITVAQSQ